MDLSTLVGYLETLALLYGWTLLAALVFSVVERFVRKQPAPDTPPNHPAS